MDDVENDGRDYSENIDEGPTSNIETEGFFSSDKKDTQKKDDPEKDGKIKTEIVKPAAMAKGPCVCKRKQKGTKHRKRKFKAKRKSKRRSLNPFIIFYLQMYYKNPSKCITEVACEAGKIWCSMTSKQKEEYIKKARSQNGKIFKKTISSENSPKKGRKKGKKIKSEDKKIKKEKKDC